MSAALSILHVARVTIKAVEPLSATTGASDPLYDTLLVRDANGLPMILGTSIAGVLRHLYHRSEGRDAANALFGLDAAEIRQRARRADRGETRAEPAEYEASALHVSASILHDQTDRPVAPRLANPAAIRQDPVLSHALADAPVERDHVRLSHRGVADAEGFGKFTRAAVAVGNRFTFELALWSAVKPDPRWTRIRELVGGRGLRLGGGTRRGYGGVTVIDWRERVFDLTDRADAQAYRTHGRAEGDARWADFSSLNGSADHGDGAVVATLELAAEDFFRFGAGAHALSGGDGKPADLLPVSEPVIDWEVDRNGKSKGFVTQRRATVPGSAVKGALAHRVAFHHDRLTGRFFDPEASDAAEENDAVTALFGTVRDSDDGRPTGHAGRVIVAAELTDPPISGAQDNRRLGIITHNGIDRFSGGTRHGVLYGEELLFEVPLTVTVTILPPAGAAPVPLAARQALHLALADLAEGRLALGAGGSKGHGYFGARDGVAWSDGGAWVEGREA